MFLLLTSFLPTAAYSEDTLTSLQQDVVMAKQKHQAIVAKSDMIPLSLEEQATQFAKEQASKMIAERKKTGSTLISPSADVAQAPLRLADIRSYKDNLEKTRPVRIQTALPAADIEDPVHFLDMTPPTGQYLKKPEDRKFWKWPQLDSLLSGGQKKQRSDIDPFAKGQDVSEAEALYRAAIANGTVTVQEAVEVGLAANIQLNAAKKNIEVAEAKLTEAKRSLFPTVQGVMEINGGKLPGSSGSRFYKGRNQKLNLTQPIYYGGELTQTVEQAKENLRSAKEEYKKQRTDFVHQMRVAYFGVVKAVYNTQYQIELFDRISVLRDTMSAQRKARVSAEIDFLNVESQYQQVLYQVEASKSDVLSANISLKQSMDLDIDGTIPVDLNVGYQKINAVFNELVGRALQNNGDIRVKAHELEAARHGIEIYEAKKKPHFELRGSYGMLGEAFHDTQAFEENKASIDQEKEWFLGVHGSMPLGANSVEYEQVKHVYGPTVLSLTGSEDWKHSMRFNLFDKFGELTDEKTAQYVLLQNESEYRNVRDEVILRLKDEYYNLQKYAIQVDSSTARMKFHEKQIAIYDYLFSMQEVSMTDYLDDLMSLAQDRYSFIQAIVDYQVSLSQIGVLIGDPDYFEYYTLLEKPKSVSPEPKKEEDHAAQTTKNI